MKRLVLAGGGHSHIEVLRRYGADPPRGVVMTLVTPYHTLIYTGMLPGLVAGIYQRHECEIDLVALVRNAGAEWVASSVVGVEAADNAVRLADGSALTYDILSLDIGSTPPRKDGTPNSAVAVKPMENFLRWWESLLSRGTAAFPLRICVAGAGAGGVELALAMDHRLHTTASGKRYGNIFIVTDTQEIMPGHNPLVRRWLKTLLAQRGITVHTCTPVSSMGENRLHTPQGGELAFDHLVWTSGAAPPDWLKHSGLACDKNGFVAVNEFLQSPLHPEVFAAGDIATQLLAPRPKAGVFAVRQGPVLAANLHRALDRQPLVPYRPQRHALALIGTGERYAIASRGPLALKGAWVWAWKERIDRNFVAKYRQR